MLLALLLGLLACGDKDPDGDGNDNTDGGGVDGGAADGGGDGGADCTWYADDDGDGYGDPDAPVEAPCDAQPTGTVEQAGDCDDGDAAVNPGAVEVCNGKDDDCSVETSEAGWATWTDEDGVESDWSGLVAGTAEDPAVLVIEEPGSLQLCGGTYTLATVFYDDATVRGIGRETVIDASGASSAFLTAASGVEMTVEHLAIEGGFGSLGRHITKQHVGGGVFCESETGADLVLHDVEIRDTSARLGSGLYAAECDTVLEDVVLRDNAASVDYGAAYLWGGTHRWTRVEVADNDAGTLGTSVLFYGGDATFEDVRFDEEGAYALGLMGTQLLWTSTASGVSGLTGGAAVEILGEGAFLDARYLDFGAHVSDEPAEIRTGAGLPYTAGEEASFTCDASRCGEEQRAEVGTSYVAQSWSRKGVVLNVAQAEVWATVESVEVPVGSYPVDSCAVQSVVYRTEDPALGPWELVTAGEARVVTSSGWEVLAVGALVEAGSTYGVGLAYDCGSGTYITGTPEAPQVDLGFGPSEGTVLDASWGGDLETLVDPVYDASSGGAVAPMTITWASL